MGSIFNNSSRKRKGFCDCLNLLRVCHLVRQALFSTRGSYERGGFAHSKVKETTKAPLAQSARLRQRAADGAGDAAVPIGRCHGVLRKLFAANAAVFGVAHLFDKVVVDAANNHPLRKRVGRGAFTIPQLA